MRAVGIDIGSYSVKAAEIEINGKNVTVRNFTEIELPHEPGQDIRLEKIEALKKILALFEPSKHRIVVGLSSEFAAERRLTFPFVERRKIMQSLPFELEDQIPFSQESSIFDLRVVGQAGALSDVLAVAVPKKHIQDLLGLCEDAGLDPDIISLDGIALSNLFENEILPTTTVVTQIFSENEDKTVVGLPEGPKCELVLQIGYSKTLINIISNGQLLTSRAIFFGGKDLAQAISRAYQLPYLEALKGIAEKGFVLTTHDGANEDQIEFSNVVKETLGLLINDVRRTVVDTKAEIHAVFTGGRLLGGMSRLINIGPFLSKQLDFPISVYEHLGQSTKVDIATTASNEKASAVAIGLALEAARKTKSPAINLRKNEFSKQNQNIKIFWERYSGLAKTGAALLVALFIYSGFRVGFSEDNLTVVEKALKDQAKNPTINLSANKLKPEAIRKFVKAKRDELTSKKEVLRLNQMNSALDVVVAITRALPQKNQVTLDITSLIIDQDRLSINGVVNSKAEIDSIKQNLSQATMLTQVTATALNGAAAIAPGAKVPFQLTAYLTRLPAPEKKVK